MDPLSDILAILKPRSYLTAGVDAGGDWAIRSGNRTGTIKCHAVMAGACWLAVDGMDAAVRLTAGDCIILPSGRPFMLASDLKLTPAEAHDVLGDARPGEWEARQHARRSASGASDAPSSLSAPFVATG